MATRWHDESGFGMLELLIAIVVLNIGLFALIGAFNASTIAVQRAGSISSAESIADAQMELYRSLPNCAIYLDAVAATTTFPVKNSGSLYQADTAAFSPVFAPPAPVAFFDKSLTQTGMATQPWATSATDSALAWNGTIPSSCTAYAATQPILTGATAVRGPDGTKYTVYTYMTIVQYHPGQADAGDFTKRVTVVVYSSSGKQLARETSIFDPTSSK